MLTEIAIGIAVFLVTVPIIAINLNTFIHMKKAEKDFNRVPFYPDHHIHHRADDDHVVIGYLGSRTSESQRKADGGERQAPASTSHSGSRPVRS